MTIIAGAQTNAIRLLVVVGSALSGTRAFAQQTTSPLSLGDQTRALQVIATVRLAASAKQDDALKRTDEGMKVTAFVEDPFCASAPCVARDGDPVVRFRKSVPTAAEIQLLASKLNALSGAPQSASTSQFPSQAALINGLSDLGVNRAKDELAVTFLISLRDRFKNDSLLSHVFAQTLAVAADLEARSVK